MAASPDEIAAIDWYHTIELPGARATPGFYDHRGLVAQLPFPASLEGKRCLDIGSSDGFWAFEMWRRGAAEVVSVDLEDPARQDWQGGPRAGSALAVSSGRWEGDTARTRRAFELARAALGADVQRLGLSAYDLSPRSTGTFDFVFMGSLLLHLRDPARALAAAHSVCHGRFLLLEPILLGLSVLFRRTPLVSLWPLDEPRWFQPNLAALRRLVESAGFDVLESGGPRAQKFGRAFSRRPPLRRPTRAELFFWAVVRPFGVPSGWVLAQPSPAPAAVAERPAANGSRPVRMPLAGWY